MDDILKKYYNDVFCILNIKVRLLRIVILLAIYIVNIKNATNYYFYKITMKISYVSFYEILKLNIKVNYFIK